ncbi:23S rRNA (adenine(2030)-N(6))-methyltransferase RlmJ [Mesorhizobium sp.]|uniref:23S rRNA (adenine(2030)-N(6))-methyltransferase RlmJ n=1 Tax=Mesorhizobium sp. TaxID=1871066 RepID=UPI000FE2F3E3|nr:23S rRNA (adenine(2030)-N(6))-methyltransferase RlmJ [Mesorhizobium sp.]RWH71468.1 MAG: 23S rRNA (adenine(2030)-N(6))-methyltransferase RlmJ [Mesorhizobium sp.]RWL30369.1 MAG: 23S rRNA (adenine(2030)-N(6))-methyltransferase RlmJ [Mesorhizobium sp.]RWL32590.1 MAG: 23S rRNA (adenine(2030)-N(6))-methyltransferase RlmJ [Mesorhizobium sp.]RWL39304.1 MAG: 23S rRNA (adenine(2030)-N(6))-methyltransferase RlmJ [Mesorhizobium sp.]RWL55206.1 MAG: 23S rRNA (adenine(2030)-N(6))-methyltransferase RlmJ [M
MNYRHAYHAGNFADVVKHAVLARLVEYLKQKDKAFRVIDTHAGIGRYDLASVEAGKTGEWQGGIGRLTEATLEPQAAALLQPYLEAVRAQNPEGGLKHYPGSPLIVRHLLRNQDRLTAIELHPEDAARLKSVFEGDFQARVIELDGWLALGAQLPPKEKRGLVLIDPPFEEEGEFSRLIEGLRKAHRRWPGGIYALWYPIKDRRAVTAFRAALKEAGIPKLLDVALEIRPGSDEPSLDGSGLVVVNPPYTLEGELKVLLPALHKVLAVRQPSRWTSDWLAGE